MFVAVLATATLASCGSMKIASIPVPTKEIKVMMPVKVATIGEEAHKHWAHSDLATDTIPGISLDKAYKFLEGKKSTTVIVGVIDSGIDIEHEDLKGVLWINPKEIAGNGIDDDKNGYVDDIYGWNFLGGEGVAAPEQLELTRMYKAGKTRFEGKTATDVAAGEKGDFDMYLSLKEAYTKKAEGGVKTLERMDFLLDAISSIKSYLGKDSFNLSDVTTIKTDDTTLGQKVAAITAVYGRGASEKGIVEYRESLVSNKSYDLDFNGRMTGDDHNNISVTNYGNAFVIGSKEVESHGTHVSGIILADRTNNLGMMGVANNAVLMSVRAVPDGDEYDKDVALAIRYVVDNGAKVVNMSFGKSYSPKSEWVFDAIRYAAKHDVLLVHAAGNSGENIDVEENFPNDSMDKVIEISDNVLTVGAMSEYNNEKLPASFSNYGKLNVDVFAPGVQIYSTVPQDKYAKYNGTSMASPEAAGVATLVRSYYPSLSASQVKHILMNSSVKFDREMNIPGKKEEKTSFRDLSVSGGVVNAYNALKMADEMVNGK